MFEKYYRNKFIKLITSAKINDNRKALKLLNEKKITLNNDEYLQSLYLDYCIKIEEFELGIDIKKFTNYGITIDKILSNEIIFNYLKEYYSKKDIYELTSDEFFKIIYNDEKYKEKYRNLFIKENIYELDLCQVLGHNFLHIFKFVFKFIPISSR